MNEMKKRNEGSAERKRGGWPRNYGPGHEAYCLHCNKRIDVSLCLTREECTLPRVKKGARKDRTSGSVCKEASSPAPGSPSLHAPLVHGGSHDDAGADKALRSCRAEDVPHDAKGHTVLFEHMAALP